MKTSSRLGDSVCGAVLPKRPSTRLGPTPSRSFCTARDARTTESTRSRPGKSFFCSRSSLWIWSTFSTALEPTRVARIPQRREVAHAYSTAAAALIPNTKNQPSSSPGLSPPQDKQNLLSFVQRGNEGTVQEHLEFYKDPYRRGYAQSDGPTLRVSDKKSDVEYPSRDETPHLSNELQQLLAKIYSAVGQRLRRPSSIQLESIYKLYLQLPEPRMLHLTGQWRSRFLKIMGTPRKRSMESMLRYFALVSDVKNAGLTLGRSQWNYGLAFATKYVARATTREMESGLRLWKEMEKDAHVQGNEVTFNILFDVATKSGNFTLAEMIYKEMENRGMEFNRFHHVSLIHFFGLKLDSNGIRAAYADMVNAGEMIDTVVLNCVISGLLRCGEEASAVETYERMKNGHALAMEIPARDYMMNKVVTKVLLMFSKVSRQYPPLKQSLQLGVQLVPDLHTYQLLVEHYAVRVGDLKKVAQFLDEMKVLKIPIHPTIFLALLKGFYTHGGYAGSDWSEKRLVSVLEALYNARDDNARGFRIDRWLVIWALRAVKKCRSTEDVIQTFDSMAQRWDIPPERQSFMHDLLDTIVHDRDLKSPWGKWDGPSHQRKKKDGSRL
ncbi:pentatricopeptide repeat containing protein [Paramyrothecium foliicola]|nr:pentatricopeptide repeat containing protein [Paramyrothecium foliicola]